MSSSWVDVTTGGLVNARKFVCTDGTEAFAEGTTDGIALGAATSVIIVVEADNGQTLSGAGTIQVHFYDPDVGGWARAPDYDISIPASASGYRRYEPLAGSPGRGIPLLNPRGRMGVGISGVTISSGGVTVYLLPVA